MPRREKSFSVQLNETRRGSKRLKASNGMVWPKLLPRFASPAATNARVRSALEGQRNLFAARRAADVWDRSGLLQQRLGQWKVRSRGRRARDRL